MVKKVFQHVSKHQRENARNFGLYSNDIIPIVQSNSLQKNMYNNVEPTTVRGPYKNESAYLKQQRGLLSADFLSSLSEQVNIFKETRAMSGRIFEVNFASTEKEVYKKTPFSLCTSRHLDGIFVICRGEKFNRIIGDDKRFMFGSLLLFSQDDFQTYIVGIVKRGIQGGQMVVVLFPKGCCEPDTSKVKRQQKYHMMEAEAFYFPYLHVLDALSNIVTVPFAKELVEAEAPSAPPQYLEKRSTQVRAVVGRFKGDLNDSQFKALHTIFKHRVALVQGPPGTGKTYLGCKIVEALLLLKKKGAFRSPILVVTTTQHAVDEFLTRCFQFTNKVIHGCSTASTSRPPKIYGNLQKRYNASTAFSQLDIMSKADVIGVTTTRGAFIHSELSRLDITVVIAEEAAEAMEAFIVACIPDSAEHLILLVPPGFPK